MSRFSATMVNRSLAATSVKFMHIGPDALARAKGGELKLTYLYRPVAP